MSNNEVKKKLELNIVQDFLKRLGHNISDYKIELSEKPDFRIKINNKIIGIEQTTLHPDDTSKKGSKLRKKESYNTKNNIKEAQWVTGNFIPALNLLLQNKIGKAQNYNNYDSLWLLISSGIPKQDAIISTHVFRDFIDIKQLNQFYNNILIESTFDAVYWYIQIENILFVWTRETNSWVENSILNFNKKSDNLSLEELESIINDPEWQKESTEETIRRVAKEIL
ncbi:MAG: hypothetical protein WCJ33_00130 [Pseudomonadota bacterium]